MDKPAADRASVIRRQEGVVAIFSVLIIMGILTLLTVAFSNLSRQSLRRTLDDQLNTQALYAAEAGVNQVWNMIMAGPLGADKETCDGGGFDYDVDGTNNVAISCLMYSRNVLNYENSSVPVVGEGDPAATRIEPVSGDAVRYMDFEWDAATEGAGLHNGSMISGNSPELPPRSSWGTGGLGVGMLRVDLVPASSLDRASTVTGSYSFFLYPSGSSGTMSNPSTGTPSMGVRPGGATADQHGPTLVTRCANSGEYRCFGRVVLEGPAVNDYYMRVTSYYDSTKIRATARNASNTVLRIQSQVLVDVTGKANDVYRRIQVRLPADYNESYNVGLHNPYSLISGDSICKRFIGVPGAIRIDGPTDDPGCDLPAGVAAGGSGDSNYTNPCANNACSPNGDNSGHPCITQADNGQCYTQVFQNNSNNPNEIVASCTWDWGDGTVDTDGCYAGDYKQHRFPVIQPECIRSYRIVLTINFNNGAPPAVYSNTRTVPWGGPGRVPCA